MQIKLDTQILIYFAVVGVLLLIVAMLKFKNGILMKILFRIAAGGGFILIFNYIIKLFNSNGVIPFNPITVLTAAFLEIPGVALILIVKYIIYP